MFAIIAQIHHSDLVQEEARVKAERDQRRMLQSQTGVGVSIGDLLTKLAGTSEEKVDEPAMTTRAEVPNAKQLGGFPPPPSGPTGSTGSAR